MTTSPNEPGSLGTTWRGRDRATVRNDRAARQAARAKRRQEQPPPAQPSPAQPYYDQHGPWPSELLGGQPDRQPDPIATMFAQMGGGQLGGGGGDIGSMMAAMFGGGMGGGYGAPPPTSYLPQGMGGPPSMGGGGPQDPLSVYLSTVPVMDNMMKDRISGAMSQAGLTGGRFSSAAQNTAAKIGAETGLQQNQMLNQLLYNHTQQDLDRSLQSTLGGLGFGGQDLDRELQALLGMGSFGEGELNRGLQAGGMLGNLGMGFDQLQRNRLDQLSGIGQYEQGRQDRYSLLPYQEFLDSRMGYLPLLASLVGSQSNPAQPQGIPMTTNAQPGLINMLPYLLPLFTGG